MSPDQSLKKILIKEKMETEDYEKMNFGTTYSIILNKNLPYVLLIELIY